MAKAAMRGAQPHHQEHVTAQGRLGAIAQEDFSLVSGQFKKATLTRLRHAIGVQEQMIALLVQSICDVMWVR